MEAQLVALQQLHGINRSVDRAHFVPSYHVAAPNADQPWAHDTQTHARYRPEVVDLTSIPGFSIGIPVRGVPGDPVCDRVGVSPLRRHTGAPVGTLRRTTALQVRRLQSNLQRFHGNATGIRETLERVDAILRVRARLGIRSRRRPTQWHLARDIVPLAAPDPGSPCQRRHDRSGHSNGHRRDLVSAVRKGKPAAGAGAASSEALSQARRDAGLGPAGGGREQASGD